MPETALTRDAKIRIPLICGAMYPCSNPELVAAVSEAGGIGIIQPMSLVYVHGHDFAQGMTLIRSLTSKPVGLNVILETSSKLYMRRMRSWVEQSIESGVRFFVTSLGNPRWVAEMAHAAGGHVYHDVTEEKWARKALDNGADGLIAVNSRAGGHAGRLPAEPLLDMLRPLGRPVVAAGGVGDELEFVRLLSLGYDGVQLGTRFIATRECSAHQSYKDALVSATASDIVLTERVTGVPLAVINTPYVQRIGTRAGPIARMMLRGRRTKHLMRTIYAVRSAMRLKQASIHGGSSSDYWQAGKSVDGINAIESAADIVRRYGAAAGF